MFTILANFDTPAGSRGMLITKGGLCGDNVFKTKEEAVSEVESYIKAFIIDSPDGYQINDFGSGRTLTVFRKEDMASWEFKIVPLKFGGRDVSPEEIDS